MLLRSATDRDSDRSPLEAVAAWSITNAICRGMGRKSHTEVGQGGDRRQHRPVGKHVRPAACAPEFGDTVRTRASRIAASGGPAASRDLDPRPLGAGESEVTPVRFSALRVHPQGGCGDCGCVDGRARAQSLSEARDATHGSFCPTPRRRWEKPSLHEMTLIRPLSRTTSRNRCLLILVNKQSTRRWPPASMR